MSLGGLIKLEVAEAAYLLECGWEPLPKPPGTEKNLSVPQFWKDPKGAETGEEDLGFRQDIAVGIQRLREDWPS